MTDALATTVIVAGLLVAAYSLFTVFRDRPMGWSHLAGLGVLEVLLVIQAVVGFTKLADDQGPQSSATFVGYLLGILLIPPAAAGWGLLERSRWGPAVLVVAGLSVAVMVARLGQLWDGTSV